MSKKTVKKLLLRSLFTSIGILCVVFALLVTTVLIVVSPKRAAVNETPRDYDLAYENISFDNYIDGTTLRGWWIPSTDSSFESLENNTVIFSHGFGDSRTSMPINSLQLAKRLTESGYNVLMFDFRNSGKSDGDQTTIGYYEKYDVLSAIQFAKQKKSTNVALLGWSMGAASSILAGSESKDVSVIIADSPFADFKTYLGQQLSYWTKLPNLLAPLLTETARLVTGIKPSKISPEQAAIKIQQENKPMLLIHSKHDNAIPYKNSVEIHQKNPNSELWLTNKGGHIRSYLYLKQTYETRILDFLDKYMKKDIQEMYVFSFLLSCTQTRLIKYTLLWHNNFFFMYFLCKYKFDFLNSC